MWTTRAAAIAIAALGLVAVLVVADTQYTMRITITDPTFRSAAFETALGRFAEHRDSCPLRFIAQPPQGSTAARTVQVVFSIDSGASAACATSLRSVMDDQGADGPSFVSFRSALTTSGVGTLLSITTANPAPADTGDDNDQNKLWVFIGAGVVAGVVVLIGVAMLVLRGKERRAAIDADAAQGDHLQPLAGNDDDAGAARQPTDSNGNGEDHGAARTLAQPEPKPELKPEPAPELAPVPAPVATKEEEKPAPPVPEQPAADAAAPPAATAEEADDVAVEEDEEDSPPAASPQEGNDDAPAAAAPVAEATPTEEPAAATTEEAEAEAEAEEAPATEAAAEAEDPKEE